MLSLFASLCQISTLHAAWRQVKAKNSAGGIDGFSVLQFDENLQGNLNKLSEELRGKSWNPEPYLRVEIPKKENEKRQLGLLSVKDKIVQQAIKVLIEPRFEKIFIGNSYGYRPEKGHTYWEYICKLLADDGVVFELEWVVISLVQKSEPLKMDKNLLSENTRLLLVKNILERLNRYEKYRNEEIKFTEIIRRQVREIAACIAGESKVYKPYIAKW
jgi:hypothetical protein